MSSSLSFHGDFNTINLEAESFNGLHVVRIEAKDIRTPENHHRMTVFVDEVGYPALKRAVEAFNMAMAHSGALTED